MARYSHSRSYIYKHVAYTIYIRLVGQAGYFMAHYCGLQTERGCATVVSLYPCSSVLQHVLATLKQEHPEINQAY